MPNPRVPLTTARHLERAPGQNAPVAPPAPEVPAGSESVRVRALKVGYYGDVRRKVGTEFEIVLGPGAKMPSWLERI